MQHLYIHIPFCQRRCSYCDFNTYANLDDRIEAYVVALCRELELRARESYAPTPPRRDNAPGIVRADLRPTIFFGGGTPTMLSLGQWERVLEAADRIVALRGAEVTTEANPGTVINEAYLRGLRSLGINRISFGVQSLHDPTLRVLGRIHTAAEAITTYQQALRAGFDRVNLDFIFGLPGQTLDQWRWTLDQLTTIGPEHVSLYSLVLEETTPLHAQVTRGIVTIPDDDATAAMYELAMERFAAAGYTQYEISNWARQEPRTQNPEPGMILSPLPTGACQHNVAYWLNADYVAAGAGAHGHVYPRRYFNTLGVEDYIRQTDASLLPVAETTPLTSSDLLGETMMMGLRLNAGVSHAHFRDRCDAELDATYHNEIRDLVALGLLEHDAIGIRLTPQGRMLGNEVFLRFLRDDDAPRTDEHAATIRLVAES